MNEMRGEPKKELTSCRIELPNCQYHQESSFNYFLKP